MSESKDDLRMAVESALKGEHRDEKAKQYDPTITEEPDDSFTLKRLITDPLGMLGELGCLAFMLLPLIGVSYLLLASAYQFFLVDEHRRIYISDEGEPTQHILEWYQGRNFWEMQRKLVSQKLANTKNTVESYDWAEWSEPEGEYSNDAVGELRRKADQIEWDQFVEEIKTKDDMAKKEEINRLNRILKAINSKLESN